LSIDLDQDCPEAEFPEGAVVRRMTIVNRKGLHARATAKLVQLVGSLSCVIKIARCGEVVNGTSIMGLLTLGAGIGSTIEVAAVGDGAEAGLDAIAALIADRFGEGE
jgi:phosphocarrier protein HPr